MDSWIADYNKAGNYLVIWSAGLYGLLEQNWTSILYLEVSLSNVWLIQQDKTNAQLVWDNWIHLPYKNTPLWLISLYKFSVILVLCIQIYVQSGRYRNE